MSDGMGREPAYLSSHATNRYFIPNWGIDDIHGSSNSTSYKRGIEGVFNMHGQMVRRDNSLEGLPKGMYVVNGKKVIIK